MVRSRPRPRPAMECAPSAVGEQVQQEVVENIQEWEGKGDRFDGRRARGRSGAWLCSVPCPGKGRAGRQERRRLGGLLGFACKTTPMLAIIRPLSSSHHNSAKNGVDGRHIF
jgi:hypothetical protein